MKYLLSAIIFAFTLISCNKDSKNNLTQEVKISDRVHFSQNKGTFSLTSGKFHYSFQQNILPFKRVILLNASLVGYLTQLGLEDKIIGVSSPQYIYTEKIHQRLKAGKIQNVGNEQKYNVEKIIALKPDVILTNYIATFENTYQLLKKNGIKIIFFNEYLERNPLEKSAYLKVFGKLFGVEKKADSLYTAIADHYNHLKNRAAKASSKPTIIANEMYGNQWFVPGGQSFAAQYFKAANAQYPWANTTETGNFPVSFEQVVAKSEKAKYWVNLSDYPNKQSLLALNPAYKYLNPFKNGKVYTLGGRTKGSSNDYFESGVVRADLILKDYINIFHPGLLQDSALVYMKEIK